jgi:DNA ligase-1
VTSTADVVPAALRQAALLPLQRYHPLDHAVWSAGQSAPYLALALALSAVDGTSKRNQMALGMTNFFRSLMLLSPGDVVPAAYLLCGEWGTRP